MFSKPFRGATIALAALLAGAVALPAVAQNVTVNGRPLALNPGPIEKAGRIFVPLRGIFESLDASVVYASGTINATKGNTTVSLTIGSSQATVSGQSQTLDVAPFIVGSTTYVPLRFVAQALGAQVSYDANTGNVAIVGGGGPPPPMPPPPNPPSSGVRLRAHQPAPGERVQNRFVTVAAEFTQRVNPGSVRVWIDGADITTRSGLSPTGFSYKPPAPLDYGQHTVRVAGRDAQGLRFERDWSFSVIRGGPALQLTILQPPADVPVGSSFAVAGNTIPNGQVTVTVGATPSFTGQFKGSTTAGQLGNFKIAVSLRPLMGQQAISVRITVSDPNSNQTLQKTLQLRLAR